MPTRRTFLSVLTMLGTTSLPAINAEAKTRRHRRWSVARGRRAHSDEVLPACAEKAEFIQPDYVKWQKIVEGMHRDKVRELIGEPLYREDRDPRYVSWRDLIGRGGSDSVAFIYSWKYGHLEFADPSLPANSFELCIDLESDTHTVFQVRDPFAGRFSKDGLPTVPRVLLPHDCSTWSHDPPFLDLRWEPSSGAYPICYEVDLSQFTAGPEDTPDHIVLPLEKCDVPHHTIVGSPKGRWRVRACNRLGNSAWSEYRHYEFTQLG